MKRKIFQVVDTEAMTFGSFNPNEKGRKGHFVLTGDGAIENSSTLQAKSLMSVE